MFTKEQIEKIKRITVLKDELKRLEAELRPVIVAVCDEFGHNAVVDGIKLSRIERTTVSWKELAYSVASETAINNQLPKFSKDGVAYSVKPDMSFLIKEN